MKCHRLRLLFATIIAMVIMIAAPDNAIAASSPRTLSIGRSWDLGAIQANADVSVPSNADQGAIVGIGIAGSNDHVYVWYADGKVSSGTSTNFEYYQGKTNYVLPAGKNPWDIIAMAIAGSNDHVYAWYADGTVSEGWSEDLGLYSDPQPFTLPDGYTVSSIVGIGIAGSNDHVFAWYADGTVSEGQSRKLDSYKVPYPYEVPASKKIGHIIDIAIAGSTDQVYSWYHDVESGSGHSTISDQVDAAAMDTLRRYRLPGLGVAVSKNGRIVLEKGYGFSNFTTQARMNSDMRCRIGSVSKVITALSALHLDANRSDFSVSQNVYSPSLLSSNDYRGSQERGISRYQPIVAKAIASDDHVYTWNHNGTVTEGTSRDPDFYTGARNFTLPPNTTVEEIRAIAIAPNNRTWVWYDDGSYSVGSSRDLDLHEARDKNNNGKIDDAEKVSLPKDYSMLYIVGIDFAPDGTVYVWYDNGMQSAGTTIDFDASISPRSYSTAQGKSRYDIRAIGIAKSNSHVYTWLSDNTVLEGASQNLDFYGSNTYSTPTSAYDSSKDWSSWYANMRVNHLLSHTAGFTRSGDVEATESMFNLPQDRLTYKQVHQYILGTRKLLFAPGTREEYSNHGAGLVGHIVSEVSGTSFHNYVRTNIIDPLRLNIRASSSGQTSIDTHRHDYNEDGTLRAYIDDPPNDLGLASGGWKSSAGDLVRLMLATDRNPNHPDILSPATLDLMESQPYPSASSYAHGWLKDSNSGKLAKNGALQGGTAYIAKYFNSTPVTVAVCTNVQISDARGGSNALRNLANAIEAAVNRATISSSYDLY